MKSATPQQVIELDFSTPEFERALGRQEGIVADHLHSGTIARLATIERLLPQPITHEVLPVIRLNEAVILHLRLAVRGVGTAGYRGRAHELRS